MFPHCNALALCTAIGPPYPNCINCDYLLSWVYILNWTLALVVWCYYLLFMFLVYVTFLCNSVATISLTFTPGRLFVGMTKVRKRLTSSKRLALYTGLLTLKV